MAMHCKQARLCVGPLHTMGGRGAGTRAQMRGSVSRWRWRSIQGPAAAGRKVNNAL